MTCDDLHSLWWRSNLHASRRKFLTVWPPNPSPINLLLANEIQDMSALKWVFCDFCVLERKLASPFGHPTQVSTQAQLVATCDTCKTIWTGLSEQGGVGWRHLAESHLLPFLGSSGPVSFHWIFSLSIWINSCANRIVLFGVQRKLIFRLAFQASCNYDVHEKCQLCFRTKHLHVCSLQAGSPILWVACTSGKEQSNPTGRSRSISRSQLCRSRLCSNNARMLLHIPAMGVLVKNRSQQFLQELSPLTNSTSAIWILLNHFLKKVDLPMDTTSTPTTKSSSFRLLVLCTLLMDIICDLFSCWTWNGSYLSV